MLNSLTATLILVKLEFELAITFTKFLPHVQNPIFHVRLKFLIDILITDEGASSEILGIFYALIWGYHVESN